MQANNVMRAASQEHIEYQEGTGKGTANSSWDAGKHLSDSRTFRLSLENLSWLSGMKRAFQVNREAKSHGTPAH